MKNTDTRKAIILNLWPPVKRHWKEILEIINNDFSVLEVIITDYLDRNTWPEFLIEYYSMASDPPGDVSTVNTDQMIKKARAMIPYGTEFLTIFIACDEHSFRKKSVNGNPWEPIEISKLKKKIREKYIGLGYKKFEIAHCFESYVHTDQISDLLKAKCEIKKWK